jgi:hypothetical protein
MLCAIHDATVENILFEDGDGANTFRAFNPNQTFLHLEKNIIIDLLRNAGEYTSYYIITLWLFVLGIGPKIGNFHSQYMSSSFLSDGSSILLQPSLMEESFHNHEV